MLAKVDSTLPLCHVHLEGPGLPPDQRDRDPNGVGRHRHKVMRLILRQGMSLRLIGIAAGLLISLAGDSRAIRSALRDQT